MDKRKSIRRLAMQVLYQIDATDNADQQAVFDSLDADHDPLEVREEATKLAIEAWHDRAGADRDVLELAPEWPTHRQPPVDRAILRLAYHEMKTGRVPHKIAINEAIELAKSFGSENSPAFVNGVLDKIAKQLPDTAKPASEPEITADGWLKDAMRP